MGDRGGRQIKNPSLTSFQATHDSLYLSPQTSMGTSKSHTQSTTMKLPHPVPQFSHITMGVSQANCPPWPREENGSFLLESLQHTVCFQSGGFAVPAARLIYGFHNKDVACPTLEAMHGVMVLFNVGHNHPAIH